MELTRKQALARIIEIVNELDVLQQKHLDGAATYERFHMLNDIAADAEEALEDEQEPE